MVDTMRLLVLLLAGLLSQSASTAEQDYFKPGIVLPDAEGKALILRACTGCHTLEGVPAYRKYWGYERWLPMVENMIKHGAELNTEEKEAVARYLGRYFGTEQ